MAEQLDGFLDRHDTIIREQYGYRKKKGAVDLLENFCDKINKALDDHLHAVVCFVDFSNAFDSLNHQKLLNILDDMGVRGLVKDWFGNYLFNRKIRKKRENIQ